MDAEEREIYFYLKAWKHVFVSAREICRRAGGKHRFRQDPEWAKPVLTRMVERGILEVDATGHYRLRPPDKKFTGPKRWVSPQIAQILRQSGKDFSSLLADEAELDRYYDSL